MAPTKSQVEAREKSVEALRKACIAEELCVTKAAFVFSAAATVTSVDKGANAINTRGIPRRYGIWKTALSLLSKIKTFFMVFLLGSPMATLKLGFAVLFLHVGLVCGMDNDVSPTPGGNSFLTSVQKWAPVVVCTISGLVVVGAGMGGEPLPPPLSPAANLSTSEKKKKKKNDQQNARRKRQKQIRQEEEEQAARGVDASEPDFFDGSRENAKPSVRSDSYLTEDSGADGDVRGKDGDSGDDDDDDDGGEDTSFERGEDVPWGPHNEGASSSSSSSGEKATWEYRVRNLHANMEIAVDKEGSIFTAMRSFLPGGGHTAPLCLNCGATADIRCRDLSRGGVFFCRSCAEGVHDVGCRPHRLESLNSGTHGFDAVAPTERTLRPAHCRQCTTGLFCAARDDGDAEGVREEPSFMVTLVLAQTGPVQAKVQPLRCLECDCVSGATAPEYFCISGASTTWVDQELLDERRDFYAASHYSLSDSSIAGAYARRWSARGLNENGHRTTQFAVERAGRIYDAILFQEEDIGERFSINPKICPACEGSKDVTGIVHVDACFKLREKKNTGFTHGAPLTKSSLGVSLTSEGELKNPFFQELRSWRYRVCKIPTSKQSPAPSNCPDLRAFSSQKASSKDLKISAVHLGVCRHNLAHPDVGLAVDTPGEGLEYAHYALRYLLHNSGQLPLEEVFGPCVEPPTPPLGIIHSDIPCQLIPHLRKYDPEALKLVDIKLGEVHKWNHLCHLANCARYTPGAGMGSGEQCEPYWALLNGLAPSLEHCSPAKWHEKLTFAIRTENEKGMIGTVALFGRMNARAHDRYIASMERLDAVILQIYQSTSLVINAATIAEWKEDLCDLSGSHRSSNARLSVRAQLCSAVEEKAVKVSLLDAHSGVLAQGVGTQSTEDDIDEISAKVKKLDNTIRKLLREDPTNSGEPTAQERGQVRGQKRELLRHELAEQKVLLHALDGSFKRGYNHHNHYVYNTEKQAARRRMESAKKTICFLERQLVIVSVGDLPDDAPVGSVIPGLLKLEAIDALQTSERCVEEVNDRIPKEVKGYKSACDAHATALEDRARDLEVLALQESSTNRRLLMGEATVLHVQALKRRRWANTASTFLHLSLPPMKHLTFALPVLQTALQKSRAESTGGGGSGGMLDGSGGEGGSNRSNSSTTTSSSAATTPAAAASSSSTGTAADVSGGGGRGGEGGGSSGNSSTSTAAAAAAVSSGSASTVTVTTTTSNRSTTSSSANLWRMRHCNARGIAVLEGLARVSLTPEMRSSVDYLLAPLLTDEMDIWRKSFNVARYSTKKALSYPGIRGGNVDVLEKSLWRLQPQQWFDDDLVNAYQFLLQKRSDDRNGRSLFLSTFFCEKVTNAESVVTWFRRVDFDNLNFMYIPVNVQDSHWYPVIVDLRNKQVRCFDSFGLEDRSSTLQCILAALVEVIPSPVLVEAIPTATTSTAVWTIEDTVIYEETGALVTPQQSNSYDCAIFMLTVFNFHSRGLSFLFSEAYMRTLRGRVALDILRLSID